MELLNFHKLNFYYVEFIYDIEFSIDYVNSFNFQFLLASNAVYEYASVLIARRFLLANQCFQLITDQDVRVSHKILAMACMSHLALYLPEFLEIPLNLRGYFFNIYFIILSISVL